jgi:predicted chitinase
MMILPVPEDVLRSKWPRAPDAVIVAFSGVWPEVAVKYGFNTVKRCTDFWAEISWECGGGTELRENMSYSEHGILTTFGVGVHSAAVTSDEAKLLAHRPYALAERVYGIGNPKKARELGNKIAGDGYKYRGWDGLNTTGGESINRVLTELGYTTPVSDDVMNDPAVNLWGAAQEYYDLGCIQISDSGDIVRERKRVNGGTNGLTEVEALVAEWSRYFASVHPVESTSTASPLAPKKVATPIKFIAPVASEVTPITLVRTVVAPTPQTVIPVVPGPHAADVGYGLFGVASVTAAINYFQSHPPLVAAAGVAVVALVVWVLWAGSRLKSTGAKP